MPPLTRQTVRTEVPARLMVGTLYDPDITLATVARLGTWQPTELTTAIVPQTEVTLMRKPNWWNPLSRKSGRGRDNGRYACPCCGFVTLPERGGYEICPICFWQDDGQDDPHADEVWGGPNYELSLTEARSNFIKFGACAPRCVAYVRPPTPDEIPGAREG